ncbi:dihydroxyacetone kinase [Verticillium alfalfae VaMs.102]|uniref:Dihydroxyacetone kinase n=1 Tax=Verticillium alfalfae (strain VaMs.102 / ATCC MYA-4576 / FGSC 10136) TaxID=526221 RepID=C9SSA1_VERA1|nr:dihydroxyacetone kinase [Verticillium alfalfae VaMs.102]EEY21666.1 dihydroxyacetone kinase [Verticillium alfalfae VaMs.102]
MSKPSRLSFAGVAGRCQPRARLQQDNQEYRPTPSHGSPLPSHPANLESAISNAHHDPSNHVTLISGGGAGHEPAHAAFVGRGLLSAAVSGNIFASPSVSQIVEAIRTVGGSAGTILIVKNYTGDIFHFHLAAEKARARWGHRVEVLVVGDDVAVGRQRSGKVGRRGLAGTVLVHKVLGSLSAQGKSIDELLSVGKQIVDGLVELGMGIHNEPGCQVLDSKPSLDSLLNSMLDLLLKTDDTDRAFVNFDDAKSSVLLVNNLGGTSQLELSAITRHTVQKLNSRGIQPTRILSGTLMTSLDASGFSVTILKATDEIIASLDSPTTAIGWPQTYSAFKPYTGERVLESASEKSSDHTSKASGPKLIPQAFNSSVTQACQALLAAEPQITHDDRIVGDGDCGATLSRGANAVLRVLSEDPVTESTTAGAAVMSIAHAIEESMDGTSGALYELFFTAFAAALQNSSGETVSTKVWSQAAGSALERLQAMTPARVGDRTVMDALIPFIDTLQKEGDLTKAVEAARTGRDSTKGMEASLGRAVYVAGENWGKVPDPGAEGIVAIVEGIANLTS